MTWRPPTFVVLIRDEHPEAWRTVRTLRGEEWDGEAVARYAAALAKGRGRRVTVLLADELAVQTAFRFDRKGASW